MNVFAGFLSGLFVVLAINMDFPPLYGAAVIAALAAICITIDDATNKIIKELTERR